MSVLTFDSDKELDKFLAVGCPHCKKDLTGIKWPAKGDICKDCWTDAGVELVVKEPGTDRSLPTFFGLWPFLEKKFVNFGQIFGFLPTFFGLLPTFCPLLKIAETRINTGFAALSAHFPTFFLK